MIDLIIEWDKELLLSINSIHSPFFDVVMWWISQVVTWIPLYLLIGVLIVRNFGWKVGGLALLGMVISVALADQISVKLFKLQFERLRPTHDPAISYLIHTVNGYTGGMYGFVSSHAANSFAIALFSASLLKRVYSKVFFIMLTWAFIVSYSRMYLGVHYPLDIICGGLLGALIGKGVYFVFTKIENKI